MASDAQTPPPSRRGFARIQIERAVNGGYIIHISGKVYIVPADKVDTFCKDLRFCVVKLQKKPMKIRGDQR